MYPRRSLLVQISFVLSLTESSACEAPRFQQYFCPISQLYAVSSLFAIEVHHSALLSVQLWPADELAVTDMGTGSSSTCN